MNLSFLGEKGSQAIGKIGLTLTKTSPEILLGAGIAGVVTSAILTARATLKLDSTLDAMHEQLAKLNETYALSTDLADKEIIAEKAYTANDYKRDLFITYIGGSLRLVRLYMPAIVVGGLSIAAITGSHVILKNRNVALMAAYEAVDQSYRLYRSRVREELGEEKDLEFVTGASLKKVVKNKETGIKTAEIVPLNDLDDPSQDNLPKTASPYARWWTKDTTEAWDRNSDYNLVYLRAAESMANMTLRTKGYVFLNDVYRQLGLPETQAGACVGWLFKRNSGDNFVDFGLNDPSNLAAVRESEYMRMHDSYLLDFNVDGVILDRAFKS